MSDCRTCKHNSYRASITDWVSCSHPVAIKKAPRWEEGDPAWVNMLTGDVPVSRLSELQNCPTFEPRTSRESEHG